LTATNDNVLMEKYHAMWPWIGADVVRGNGKFIFVLKI
jgi:hypothetical protein